MRFPEIYSSDKNKSSDINKEVQEWCLKYQDTPGYRIALAGYAGEYSLPGWEEISWTANACLQNSKANGKNSENRFKETLWFSPNCLISKKE